MSEGRKVFHWDGTNNNSMRVNSGIYYYILEIDSEQYSKRMILIK